MNKRDRKNLALEAALLRQLHYLRSLKRAVDRGGLAGAAEVNQLVRDRGDEMIVDIESMLNLKGEKQTKHS